jgi:hypothetical protein
MTQLELPTTHRPAPISTVPKDIKKDVLLEMAKLLLRLVEEPKPVTAKEVVDE